MLAEKMTWPATVENADSKMIAHFGHVRRMLAEHWNLEYPRYFQPGTGIAVDGAHIVQSVCISPDYNSRFESRMRADDPLTPEAMRSIGGDFLDTDSVVRIIFMITRGGRADFDLLCKFCWTYGLKLYGDHPGAEEVDLLAPEESDLFHRAKHEEDSTE